MQNMVIHQLAALLFASVFHNVHTSITSDIADLEAALHACDEEVDGYRLELQTCATKAKPVVCNCFCPTCLPEEVDMSELPVCTTPEPPPPASTPQQATPPPAPPLAPLPPLQPYTVKYLPKIMPIATVTPTTTPIPSCRDDQLNSNSTALQFMYDPIGQGICLGMNGTKIPFKMKRELSDENIQCTCREACDNDPACVGYSFMKVPNDEGLSCRVYGIGLSTLSDEWFDMGSQSDLKTYDGKEIVATDSGGNRECFAKGAPTGDDSDSPAVPSVPATPAFLQLQLHHFAANKLAIRHQQLMQCRRSKAEHLALLEEQGCRTSAWRRQVGFLRLGRVIPSECVCNCPPCNFGQTPLPGCRPPPTTPAPTTRPPPPGPTVPPAPTVKPFVPPSLPPVGNEYLPTLAPLPTTAGPAPAAR